MILKNVDTYIEGAILDAQPVLVQLRALVKVTVPQAEEVISWNQPFYKYHGFLVGSKIEPEDRKVLEAKGYTVLERAIQIKYIQKVPTAELVHILKNKITLNQKTRDKSLIR